MTEQSIDYDQQLKPAPNGTKWVGYRTLEHGQTVVEIVFEPSEGPITAIRAGRKGELIEHGAFLEGIDRLIWRVRWEDGTEGFYGGAVKFVEPQPGQLAGSVIDAALCPA